MSLIYYYSKKYVNKGKNIYEISKKQVQTSYLNKTVILVNIFVYKLSLI